MGSKSVRLGLVVLFLVAASVVSSCGGTSGEPIEPPVSVNGETLLEQRCTECHGLERTTSVQKTRAEWEETVTRMVNRGAELNEDEKTILVDYLAETYGP